MDIDYLKKICGGKVLANEPMSRHTTFKIGGDADFFVVPFDTAHLSSLLRALNLEKIDFFILGNGSNLLVSDEGYRGVVVSLGKNKGTEFSLMKIVKDDEEGVDIELGAGCFLNDIANFAISIGGSGFEPLAGIPGCIGGASVMNAGAFGTEIKDLIKEVSVLDRSANIKILKKGMIDFRYRGSSLMDQGLIVTKVLVHLDKKDPEKIKELTREFFLEKKEKQPYEYPSAGSTFKRPSGYFPGKLISDAGLKGYNIGGASVSEKHCGFLINKGNASASDMYRLIKYCRKQVFEKFGVKLEPEVQFLGEF